MKYVKIFLIFALFYGAYHIRTLVEHEYILKSKIDRPMTVFSGPDSYYHMRRALWIVNQYPKIPYRDNYLFYPEKGHIPWSGGYDILLATGLKIVHIFTQDLFLIERFAAYINIFITFLTMILFYFLMQKFIGKWYPLIGMSFIALSEGHVNYSIYGNVDHHAFNGLLILVIGLLFAHILKNKYRRISCVLVGLLMGFSQFCHTGIVKTGLLIFGTFVFFIIQKGIKKEFLDNQTILKYRDFFASASISTFAFSLLTPWGQKFIVDFSVFSYFQVLAYLCAFIFIQLYYTIYLKAHNTIKPKDYISITLGLGVVVFAFARQNLVDALIQGFNFVSGNYWFLGITSESFSPFKYGYQIGFRAYSFFPIIILLVSFHFLKKYWDNKSFIFLFLIGVCHILTGFSQTMFAVNSVVFLAILASVFLKEIGIYISAKKWGKRSNSHLIVFCIFAICILPFSIQFTQADGKAYFAKSIKGQVEFLQFLKKITPPTKGFQNYEEWPEYSIFARRDLGHHIIYISNRPVNSNPFGITDHAYLHDKDFANFELSNNPDVALSLIDKHRSKYLISSPLSPDEFRYYGRLVDKKVDHLFSEDSNKIELKDEFYHLMNSRLFAHDGSSYRLGTKVFQGIPWLKLIYQSNGKIRYFNRKLARYNLYQIVQGAKLYGTTDPNCFVNASIKLMSNIGRTFIYSNFSYADTKGRFEIKFPYPSELNYKLGVIPTEKVQIECGAARTQVEISELAVLNGQKIKVNFRK